MSIQLIRAFYVVALLALVNSTVELLGCSKADDDTKGATTNPSAQAQAAQASIASAQAAQAHGAAVMAQDDGAAAPMAMGDSAATAPSMNMNAPAGAPTGMARMLGQPPMTGASNAKGGLPPAMGAPHLYHLGAETFFLDQAGAIGLTGEQQKKLAALKEGAALAYATTQRKIDQGEQDLWVLSSSEAPDVAKIEMKIGEITRLAGQQRMDFIRTEGIAVSALSDAQRKAVASQGAAMQPGAMPPGASAPGMSMGGAAPPSAGMGGMGMGMGGPGKMSAGPSGGMPPAGMGKMGGMPDSGSSGGMGHM